MADMVTSPSLVFPRSLREWKNECTKDLDLWRVLWAELSPFFRFNGYELFSHNEDDFMDIITRAPRDAPSCPAADSFGLLGQRDDYHSQFDVEIPIVHAARDMKNRDVIIKLVGIGSEGANEIEILRVLNTEPLVSDPRNATVPVLEFLDYGACHFVVMPMWEPCEREGLFPTARGCLDFTSQLFGALSFLHDHGIAHRDISPGNIAMNVHGTWNEHVDGYTVPIRFAMLDFGISCLFDPKTPIAERSADPVHISREQCAPEMFDAQRYNPFASDVYMAARMLCEWFKDITVDIPELLVLFADMSTLHPPERISMSAAYERARRLLGDTSPHLLDKSYETIEWNFLPVHRPYPFPEVDFPKNLFEWKHAQDICGLWERLRPLFGEHHYIIFTPETKQQPVLVPRDLSGFSHNLTLSATGVSPNYISKFPIRSASVYAARDAYNRDVIIKVVGHDKEGASDFYRQISQPEMRKIMPHIALPLAKIIDYNDWTFFVMPWLDPCDDPPMETVHDALKFMQDVLECIYELHSNGTAHCDIDPENIMSTVHGGKRCYLGISYSYVMINFMHVCHFAVDVPAKMRVAAPFPTPRLQSPPEMHGKALYDPFAADVYQVARIFYAWFHTVLDRIPGMLFLLQDMAALRPEDRISITTARARFLAIKSNIMYSGAHIREDIVLDSSYPPIPGCDAHLVPLPPPSPLIGSAWGVYLGFFALFVSYFKFFKFII